MKDWLRAKGTHIVDSLVEKTISRKLLVFGIATWLMYVDKISVDIWTEFAMVYVGIQGAHDIIKEFRK